jgi:hypothetical protein
MDDPVQCSGHGLCQSGYIYDTCKCESNWSGKKCDKDLLVGTVINPDCDNIDPQVLLTCMFETSPNGIVNIFACIDILYIYVYVS